MLCKNVVHGAALIINYAPCMLRLQQNNPGWPLNGLIGVANFAGPHNFHLRNLVQPCD